MQAQPPENQAETFRNRNELTRKVGIKNKRLAAALDETYLEKVLVGT